MGKAKQQDNPFIEPSQQHAVVDMKGKFVLVELSGGIFFILNDFDICFFFETSFSLVRRRDGVERYHRTGGGTTEQNSGARR